MWSKRGCTAAPLGLYYGTASMSHMASVFKARGVDKSQSEGERNAVMFFGEREVVGY